MLSYHIIITPFITLNIDIFPYSLAVAISGSPLLSKDNQRPVTVKLKSELNTIPVFKSTR